MTLETGEDFAIRPPTTTGDDGKPSGSLLRDVRRVFALTEDERLLAAQELYESVRDRLQEYHDGSSSLSHEKATWFSLRGKHTTSQEHMHAECHEYHAANDLIMSKKTELDNLEKRAAVVRRARQTLDVDEDWTLSQTAFGVTTYYRREKDNSLSIKMDGELSGVPLFEQVAVLKEVDLHYKWAPFCSSSMIVKDLDKLDTVGWFMVGLPQFGLARDGCFRAFGCDNMMADGCVYLVGQGIEDREEGDPYEEEYFLENMEGLDIPDPPTRMGSGRTTIRKFAAEIRVLSPTRVRTRVVGNANPNLAFIPQSLLDFLMRKLCGVVFFKLQHAAKKASSDPVRNAHARRMRQEDAFYRGWLMPKFQSYCDFMGWTMPPVAAFNLTDEQLLEEDFRVNATSRSTPNTQSEKSSEESSSSAPDEIHPSASAPDLHFEHIDSSSTMSSVSGISTFTTKSFLRNNPISQFLREVEERTQKEKELKIAAGRERAAARLRPRSLSQDNHVRLQELKVAKARRVHPRTSSFNSESNSFNEENQDENGFTDRFHSHGRFTRSVVMSTLSITFLIVLYSDVLLGFHAMLRIHADTLLANFLLDVATFVYLGISAFVHFELCYVALMYAFGALEIGTKIGRSSRRYYGETIRTVVGGTSGAIVVLCIFKAIASVWLRLGLWYILHARSLWRQELGKGVNENEYVVLFLDHIPLQVQSSVAAITSKVSWSISTLISAAMSIERFIQHWFVTILFRSNFIGRFIARIFAALIAPPLAAVVPAWNSYTTKVTAMYTEDDAVLASWRGDAIEMARPLLAYTAVFLISLVILFNALPKPRGESRKTREKIHESANTQTLDSSAPSMPPAGQPARAYRPQQMSSVSMQADMIPEEDEDMSVLEDMPSASSAADGAVDAKRKKRLRFRLGKTTKEAVSESAVVQCEHSSEIKRMQTY